MKNTLLALLVLAMLLLGVAPVSFGAPPIGKEDDQGEPKLQGAIDDRPDPLTLRQRELRKKALEAKLAGKAYGKIHEVARGQFDCQRKKNCRPRQQLHHATSLAADC